MALICQEAAEFLTCQLSSKEGRPQSWLCWECCSTTQSWNDM